VSTSFPQKEQLFYFERNGVLNPLAYTLLLSGGWGFIFVFSQAYRRAEAKKRWFWVWAVVTPAFRRAAEESGLLGHPVA